MLKMLNGYANIHRNKFCSLKKDRTGGHDVTLVKDYLHIVQMLSASIC